MRLQDIIDRFRSLEYLRVCVIHDGEFVRECDSFTEVNAYRNCEVVSIDTSEWGELLVVVEEE